MELFLRVERDSNILGSSEKSITFIAISSITTIEPDFNGGSVIKYGSNKELMVDNQTPDSLMNNCIFRASETELLTD